MPPSIIESYNPETKEWLELATVDPGRSKSMADYTGDGKRHVLFDCAADNLSATVRATEPGADFNPQASIRGVTLGKGIKLLATVKEGGEPFEMDIQPEKGPAIKIQLIHRTQKTT